MLLRAKAPDEVFDGLSRDAAAPVDAYGLDHAGAEQLVELGPADAEHGGGLLCGE